MLENQEVLKNIHLHIQELTGLVHPVVVLEDHLINQEHRLVLDLLPARFLGHQGVVEVAHQDPLDLGVRAVPVQELRKNSIL